MLMQDDTSSKRVIWMSKEENNKLIADDSVRDLVYKQNPDPVVNHKSEDVKPGASIMKVKTDPFYAECFPSNHEEVDQSAAPQEQLESPDNKQDIVLK